MSNLASTIDRLGVLKAQMAELATEEKALKAVIIDHGPGAYEGELFRATVSESERATLDMDAVRAKLSPRLCAVRTRELNVSMLRTERPAMRL